MTDKQVHEAMKKAYVNDLYQRLIVAIASTENAKEMLAAEMHAKALDIAMLAGLRFCQPPPPVAPKAK